MTELFSYFCLICFNYTTTYLGTWATGRKKGAKLKTIGGVKPDGDGKKTKKPKKAEVVQKKRERRVEGGVEGEVETAGTAAGGDGDDDDGYVPLVKRAEEDWFMDETADRARKRTRKADAKAGKAASFGWDVFNSDSMRKAHEKRIGRLVRVLFSVFSGFMIISIDI